MRRFLLALFALLCSALLSSSSPADVPSLEFVSDTRYVDVLANVVTPPGPFRAFEGSLTIDGFAGEQSSRYYPGRVMGSGRLETGPSESQADPESFNTLRTHFTISEPTTFRIVASLHIVDPFFNSAAASVSLTRGAEPPYEELLAENIGALGGDLASHRHVEETFLLTSGTYNLTAGCWVQSYEGAKSSFDVMATVLPSPQELPGASPVALALALLAVYSRWGR